MLSLRPAEQAPLAPRGERGPSSCSATGAPTPEGEEEEQEGRKRWLLLLLPRRCSQKNRRHRRMLHFSPTSPASWPRPLPSSPCGLRTGHSSSQTSGTSKRNGERRKREQRRGRKFGKRRTKSTDEFRELSAETSLTLVPPPGTLSSTPPLEPKQQDRLRPLVCVWPRGPSFSRRRRRGKRGVGRGEEKAALPLACFVALLRSRSVVGAPLARTEEVGEQKSFLFRGPHPLHFSPLSPNRPRSGLHDIRPFALGHPDLHPRRGQVGHFVCFLVRSFFSPSSPSVHALVLSLSLFAAF